jgi:hypothetical protein
MVSLIDQWSSVKYASRFRSLCADFFLNFWWDFALIFGSIENPGLLSKITFKSTKNKHFLMVSFYGFFDGFVSETPHKAKSS